VGEGAFGLQSALHLSPRNSSDKVLIFLLILLLILFLLLIFLFLFLFFTHLTDPYCPSATLSAEGIGSRVCRCSRVYWWQRTQVIVIST
jgi:hypothetical protein